ncbi:MAG: hypothetical protein M9932_06400 [Xanthobacteraceae bacterium]|nr:hypothetical protein [Xanthobacteraceae bacterium]
MIADLYEAAVDDDRWPSFSKLIGKAAGIDDVAVWLTEDGEITEFSIVDTWREWQQPYAEHFSKIDPWAASIKRAPPGRVMLGYEHMREDDLVKTEFYNDFARPGGMFRPMGMRLQLAPGAFAIVGSDLPAAKRHFEESDKPRLQTLMPYVRNALKLRLRVNRQASRIEAAALNRLAFGVVICDADGRVSFANAAAEALVRSGAGVTLGGRNLKAVLPAEARPLSALVKDAAGGGPGGVVRLSGGDAGPIIALVTPLARRSDGDRGVGHAMVSLRPAWDEPAFDQAMLERLFGLSPAQAQIALALFEGRSPEQIAAERGIRITTLRTHLAEIFLRTGAETQRDLVRLLGTLPPLRGRDADASP